MQNPRRDWLAGVSTPTQARNKVIVKRVIFPESETEGLERVAGDKLNRRSPAWMPPTRVLQLYAPELAARTGHLDLSQTGI